MGQVGDSERGARKENTRRNWLLFGFHFPIQSEGKASARFWLSSQSFLSRAGYSGMVSSEQQLARQIGSRAKCLTGISERNGNVWKKNWPDPPANSLVRPTPLGQGSHQGPSLQGRG